MSNSASTETETRGLFIVIYGPNNVGKSEQVKRLAYRLLEEGRGVLKIKYPIYDLPPTGPVLNNVLRHPEKLDRKYTEAEIQKIYVQNRLDFQPTLAGALEAGVTVIAEDYKGTGIAWGMTRDVELEHLEQINSALIDPDVAILLDGERFKTFVEKGHKNEDTADIDKIWLKNRQIHLDLAKRYGWEKVDANQSKEEVAAEIYKIYAQHLHRG